MEQYFCLCGVVQPPSANRSLFEVMGVPEAFDIDVRDLSDKFRNLQRILHPDKYSQKSEVYRRLVLGLFKHVKWEMKLMNHEKVK